MPSRDHGGERVRHSEACIGRACRAARRRVEREAARVPRLHVVADDAHAHITALVAEGWSQRRIAAAAGVSVGLVNKVARWPELAIDAETEAKLLAVR